MKLDKKLIEDYLKLQLLENENDDNNIYSNNEFFKLMNTNSENADEILKEYVSNFLKLINFLDSIFDTIVENLDLLPFSIKCICKMISILLERKFPNINEIEKYKKIITNNESIKNNFDALTSASVNNIITDKSMNKNITEYRNIDSKINSFESIFKNHIKSIEEKKTPNNNTDYLVVVKKGKVNMKKNFEKANKISNINNKRISKNENKSLYIKRNIQRNKNKNLIPSYQAINTKTLISLNKKNLNNFSINNIK